MKEMKDFTQEVMALVQSNCFDLVQQVNGGDEEDYEGCMGNLYRVLESGEAIVSLLPENDVRARENTKTYTIEYDTFFGSITIIIWEI